MKCGVGARYSGMNHRKVSQLTNHESFFFFNVWCLCMDYKGNSITAGQYGISMGTTYYDALFEDDRVVIAYNNITIDTRLIGLDSSESCYGIILEGLEGFSNGGLTLDSNIILAENYGIYFGESTSAIYMTNNDIIAVNRGWSDPYTDGYGFYPYYSGGLISVVGGRIEGFNVGFYIYAGYYYVAAPIAIREVYFKNNYQGIVSFTIEHGRAKGSEEVLWLICLFPCHCVARCFFFRWTNNTILR